MLIDYRIRHCSCIEHLLGNIVLNSYENEALMFFNSWNFQYEKTQNYLRDKIGIYNADYNDLLETVKRFYGIYIVKKIDRREMGNVEWLKKVLDENKFIALSLNAYECPWLNYLKPIHGEHKILVMGYDEKGVLCSDNSVKYFSLEYNFVLQYIREIVVFDYRKTKWTVEECGKLFISDLEEKLAVPQMFHDMYEFSNIITPENIDSELLVSDLITNPLLRKISLIGFSRENYCKMLKFIYSTKAYIIEPELYDLKDIAEKWLLISKILSKYNYSRKVENINKVKMLINELAEQEIFVMSNLFQKAKEQQWIN